MTYEATAQTGAGAASTIKVILGATHSRYYLERMERHGWGRMWVQEGRDEFEPYPGEPWGFDNGIFAAHRKGVVWDEDAFMRSLERAHRVGTPAMAVAPDIYGGGEASLDWSLSWLDRLPMWPWHLAVQDGMTPEMVRPYLPKFCGLFLGGSDRFKLTAGQWAELAPLHYARASTYARIRVAQKCAKSLDTTQPLWSREMFADFERRILEPLPERTLL